MGGFNEGRSGGSGDHRTSKSTSKIGDAVRSGAGKVAKFVATGGTVGAILRSLTSNSKKKNKDGYGGEAYRYNDADEKRDYKENPFTNGNDNQPKGIELAKASTGSATILGPGEIQKEAANNVKGPTTTEMSADEILLANKRKGRSITNINKKTLAKDYKLSKKTLLG